MAKKGFIKDLNNIEILPITRGELILDSSGNLAFHSNEFLATDSLPGLMSKEDKAKLDNFNGNGTTIDLVSTTTDGLAPKIGTEAASTVTTQADEWVLTSTKGATPTWRKLPTNAFLNYYRPIQVNGTPLLENNNTALNIVAGNDINLETYNNVVRINNSYKSEFTVTQDGWYRLVTVPKAASQIDWKDRYITVNVRWKTGSPTSASFKILYSTLDGWNASKGIEFICIPLTSTNYPCVTNVRYVYIAGTSEKYIDVYLKLTPTDGSSAGATSLTVTINSNIHLNYLSSTAIPGLLDTTGYSIIERNASTYTHKYIGGLISEKAYKDYNDNIIHDTYATKAELGNYVTLHTNLTITGFKTFILNTHTKFIIGESGKSTVKISTDMVGDWARGLSLQGVQGDNIVTAGFGVKGNTKDSNGNNVINYLYLAHLDQNYNTATFKVWSDKATILNNTVLHVGNFNNYAPTLDGARATGNWNIDITGSSSYLIHNDTKNTNKLGSLQLYSGRNVPYGDDVDEWNSPYGHYDVDGIKVDFGSILRIRYAPKYYHDLWFDANLRSISFRQIINNVSYGWKTLLDSSNFSGYLDDSYVKKTGDSMSGLLQIKTSNNNQIRLIDSADNYGVLLRNDSNDFYILTTDKKNSTGSYNGLRPFKINLNTGTVALNNGMYATTGNFSGQITSTVANGTAPFVVASKTRVINLNADYVGDIPVTQLMAYIDYRNTDINDTVGNKIINYIGNVNPFDTTRSYYGAILQWSSNCSQAPSTSNSLSTWYYQLIGRTTGHGLYFRRQTNGTGWSDIKEVAFTDSDIAGNAATADKLKNKVKLWGLDFDGNADVSGYIRIFDSKGVYQYDKTGSLTLAYFGHDESLPFTHVYNGIGNNSIRLYDNGKISIPSGNVGIGTTDPIRKFVVSNNGTAGIEISPYDSDANIISYNRATNTWLPLTIDCTYFGVGVATPTHKLDVAGGAHFTDKILIDTTLTDHSASTYNCLVINVANKDKEVTLKNAPGIGFHIKDHSWGGLIFNNGFHFVNGEYSGYLDVKAKAFIKNNSSDSYILLGGGGHKLVSDFATVANLGNYLPLAGGIMTGDIKFRAMEIGAESPRLLWIAPNDNVSLYYDYLSADKGRLKFEVCDNTDDSIEFWWKIAGSESTVLRHYMDYNNFVVTGTTTSTTFQGNLDGTYVNKLTGYTKATSASDLVTTDTLNIALGKLEYKADIAYSWYRTITEDDTDEIINKWDEVVDFINGLEVDLLDEFVTRKTDLTIIGKKIFSHGVYGESLTIHRNLYNYDSVIKFSNNEDGLLGYIGIGGSGSTSCPLNPYWSNGTNAYKFWHAGNDGSGSGLDADLLDGIDGAKYMKRVLRSTETEFNLDTYTDFACKELRSIKEINILNAPLNTWGLLVNLRDGNSNGKFQFALYENHFYFRGYQNGSDYIDASTRPGYLWKLVAFTDSDITGNADSATKLQTPRKIWGNNFDGTLDVYQDLMFNHSYKILWRENTYADAFAIYPEFAGVGDYNKLIIASSVGDKGVEPTLTPKIAILGQSGNVGIGTTAPNLKLSVVGNVYSTDYFLVRDSKNAGVSTGFFNSDYNDAWTYKINDTDGTTVKNYKIPHYGYTLGWGLYTHTNGTDKSNIGSFISDYFGLKFHVGSTGTMFRFGYGSGDSLTWGTTLYGDGRLRLQLDIYAGLSSARYIALGGVDTYTWIDSRNSSHNVMNNIIMLDNETTVRNLRPQSHNTYHLGTTSYRWANVCSVLGNFSGEVIFYNGNTVIDGTISNQLRGTFANNDYWAIGVGATANDAGFVEFRTGDNGNEPIYFAQLSGSTVQNRITLMNASGDTELKGLTVTNNTTAAGFIKSGSSDSYVLLGGGGHKLVSDFATSSSLGNYLPLTGGIMTGRIAFKVNSSDSAWIEATIDSNDSSVSYLDFHIRDDSNDAFRWTTRQYKAEGNVDYTMMQLSGNNNGIAHLQVNGKITASGQVHTNLLNNSTGDLVLNSTTVIQFKCNNNDEQSVALRPTYFKPFDAANGKLDLGLSTARWKGIYGQTLDLSKGFIAKDHSIIATDKSNTSYLTMYNSLYGGSNIIAGYADGEALRLDYINTSGIYTKALAKFYSDGNVLIHGTITTTGFIKSNSSDSYVLLGGGGHKALSDLMLKSDELTNNVTTITKELTVTQDWMDTGIKHKDIPATGTYIVLVGTLINNGTDSMWDCFWSGVMTWFVGSGKTNDSETDEILLHRSGHAYNNTIYLRTVMTSGGSTGLGLKLLIAANRNLSAAYTFTFKFKRII